MNAARLERYFGADRVSAWKRARERILVSSSGDRTALDVFTTPLLADMNLT